MKELFIKRSEVEKIFWAAESVLNSHEGDKVIALETVLDIFNTCKKEFEKLQTVDSNDYMSKKKVHELFSKGYFMLRTNQADVPGADDDIVYLADVRETFRILKEDVEKA